MTGKIIKGIAGFYYVDVIGAGIYECKAKGIFRKEKLKPLVGDNVTIDILEDEDMKAHIVEIADRKNDLIRPLVANVDQAMVVFSITKPKPHFNLLDRFLVMMEQKDIPVVLVFNKLDIAASTDVDNIREVYEKSGYEVIFVSAETGENLESLRGTLAAKTTVIAGPSGVGKSSIINILNPDALMPTGEISQKIQRGKHTTRHSELFSINAFIGSQNQGDLTNLNGGAYIMDTPGFSSLYVNDFEKEELRFYFPELQNHEGDCKYNGCNHIHEPKCAVKEAIDAGDIHPTRYESYLGMYKELEEKKRY